MTDAARPEQLARREIDRLLAAAGWAVQDVAAADIVAARGVAIREFPLLPGHGLADYLLYVDAKACGVIEAKKQGATLTGVEAQSARYAQGLPPALPAWRRPLPFVYESTGIETHFTNGLDPAPRARPVFAFHRPETLADWLAQASADPPGAPATVLTTDGALMHECDVHTLLRLPTGLFYAQGVKANVIFFDKKPASETPWSKKLWIYDLRTNKHFTLKTNPLKRADLDEFVALYHPANRHQRQATWSAENPDGRWRVYEYDELVARDKASLDIFWLRDDSLADSDNLPPPEVIAQEIVDDLEAALEQFRLIASDLADPSAAVDPP